MHRFTEVNVSCISNLSKAFPNMESPRKQKIINKMWFNYGKILAEYMFLKNFRFSKKFSQKIIIKNQEVLEKVKESSEPVIFVSGHFNNFELNESNLMAYDPIKKRYQCKFY